MPLKILHRVLDDASVRFIGISNWAIDPAKLNRGLFMTRDSPDINELIASARGITRSRDPTILSPLEPYIEPLAQAYLDVYTHHQPDGRHDFFGLRDFYTTLKHLCAVSEKKHIITAHDLEVCVRRNFSGGSNIDAIIEVFRRHLPDLVISQQDGDHGARRGHSVIDLVRTGMHSEELDGRYLLVLTENNSALDILFSHKVLNDDRTKVIFGSSFPKDLEFSKVVSSLVIIFRLF
jgi:hypothetical protein